MMRPRSTPHPTLPFEHGVVRPRDRARKKQVYIVTTNWSIGGLFARGCLLPSEFGERTDVAFLDERFPASLPVVKGQIPADWSAAIRASHRNCFPIAIRLSEGKQRSIQKLMRAEGLKTLLLSDVESLIFSTEDERERFRSLSFTDLDVSKLGLDLAVAPEVFPKGQLVEGTLAQNRSDERPEIVAGPLRLADCRAGLQSALVALAPGIDSWMRMLSESLPAERARAVEWTWVEAIRDGIDRKGQQEPALDPAVLWATSSILTRDYPVNAGWPATEILGRISDVARRSIGEQHATEIVQLDVWEKRSLAVLDAREEPPDLLDEGSIPLRAILFLLLRGDIDAIARTATGPRTDAALAVGTNVRAVAACLAAVRTGLRSMPIDLKYMPANQPRPFLSFLGESIVTDLGIRPRLRASVIQTTLRELGPLHGEWILELDGEEIARRTKEVDPGLARIEAIGRELGFRFESHGHCGIRTAVPLDGGRAQEVRLTIHREGSSSDRFVRISSCVLDLSFTRGHGSSTSSTLLKAMPKEIFIDLLERNARLDLSCRFAICRDEYAVVVIIDQLLATLDDKEFRHHIGHVARIADASRREFESALPLQMKNRRS